MTEPLTATHLVYDLERATNPQISADGKRIVFTRSRVDPSTKRAVGHLWMCSIDGSDAVQLTRNGESNAGACWSPDGRWIAFVSDRANADVKSSGLFVLPADGPGEPREITRHPHALKSLAWSPDGMCIAYTTRYDPANPDDTPLPENVPPPVRVTSRIDYKRDGSGFLGDARNHLFVVDVASGERKRLTDEPHEHHGPDWSPDGRTIAIGRHEWATESSPVLVIDLESRSRQTISLASGGFGWWSWSPTGDRMVLAGESHPYTGQPDWYLYEIRSERLIRLTENLDSLPGYQIRPVWLDERTVLFSAERAGMSGLYQLDVTSGDVRELQRIPAGRGGLSIDAGRRFVVQQHESFEQVGELAVTDLSIGISTVVTNHNGALLAACPPADWERLTFHRGEFEIEGWLMFPPNRVSGERYPLVLDIHGGPQGHFGHGFEALHQVLATHGFAVLAVNPRGSTSYGRAFARQVNLDWGGEDYLDLLAAVDVVLERPDIDSSRVGMSGYSYGGYMTAWMLGQTDRFQACVCGAPVFDLESEHGTGDMDFIAGDWEWGGPPHLRREHYIERSPATWAYRATTPTLIIQGEADERCPVGQAEQMFTSLKQAGCDVELARYSGSYHGFPWYGPPAHREDYLARSLAWFQRHLNGG